MRDNRQPKCEHDLQRCSTIQAYAAGIVFPNHWHPGARKKMRVTEIKTILLDNIKPYRGGSKWLFIQLFTDEGLVGLGERVTGHATNLNSQISLLHDLCDRFVIGNSPFDIEKIWAAMYGTLHDYRHPGLDSTPAISAIEMACWDIIGKATNQPIYNLLGGKYHDKLRAYAYMPTEGVWENPEKAGEIAQALVAEGNTACKLDPFMPYFPLPRDFPLKTIRHAAKIFQCIRDAVGDELEIGIGTHGQFSTAGAIRVASILEEFNPFWFEEPVPPENVDEMARVAAHTSIPIASGERLVTKYEFSQLLIKQAAQIMRPHSLSTKSLRNHSPVGLLADCDPSPRGHLVLVGRRDRVGGVSTSVVAGATPVRPGRIMAAHQKVSGGESARGAIEVSDLCCGGRPKRAIGPSLERPRS
jgi:2-dehydro-3-deoxyphosphogalactonate aldolase